MAMPLTVKLKIYGKKVTATAFIVLILLGNVWLVCRVVGQDIPVWTTYTGYLAVVLAFLGGLLMVPDVISPTETTTEIDTNSENDKNQN
jgi:hypothetical protein